MNRVDADREQQGTYFLARLERLCHLADRFVTPPEAVTAPERLVSKAIFATYCDCVTLGYKAEAERLLANRARGTAVVDVPPSAETSPAR
jgi:hypothetical protein